MRRGGFERCRHKIGEIRSLAFCVKIEADRRQMFLFGIDLSEETIS